MGVYYHIGTELARVGMTLFARIHREGKENVPRHGPLIVVSNHMGNSDIPLVTSTVGRYVFFLAKDGLFRGPVRGQVLRGLGAFPLKRDGNDPEALRWAMRQLARDRCVGLFPEGGRSLEGSMRRASPGVAYLALKSQAPILPVAVWGTEKIRPLWRTLFAFCHMSVRVGPALHAAHTSRANVQQGSAGAFHRQHHGADSRHAAGTISRLLLAGAHASPSQGQLPWQRAPRPGR